MHFFGPTIFHTMSIMKCVKTFKVEKIDFFQFFKIQPMTLFFNEFSSLWPRMKAKDFTFRLLPIFCHFHQKCGQSDHLNRPITKKRGKNGTKKIQKKNQVLKNVIFHANFAHFYLIWVSLREKMFYTKFEQNWTIPLNSGVPFRGLDGVSRHAPL